MDRLSRHHVPARLLTYSSSLRHDNPCRRSLPARFHNIDATLKIAYTTPQIKEHCSKIDYTGGMTQHHCTQYPAKRADNGKVGMMFPCLASEDRR